MKLGEFRIDKKKLPNKPENPVRLNRMFIIGRKLSN